MTDMHPAELSARIEIIEERLHVVQSKLKMKIGSIDEAFDEVASMTETKNKYIARVAELQSELTLLRDKYKQATK